MPLVLPYQNVTWAEVTPPMGVTFKRYTIYRDGSLLVAPDGQIATLEDVETVAYADYLASPGVAHSYQIAWVGEQDGIEVESALSSPVVATALDMTGLWLHWVDEPATYVQMRGTALAHRPQREQVRQRPRGRKQGTSYFGPMFEREIEVQLVPETISAPDVWEALDELAERETTEGGVLCLRLGFRPGARYFVSSASLQEALATGLSRASVSFTESFYREVA